MRNHSVRDRTGRPSVRAAAALLCAALLGASPAQAGGSPTVAEPLVAVPVGEMVGHLEAFQEIADEHGGDRAMDSTGYAASVEYVVEVLTAAGYEPTLEEMTFEEPVVVEAPVLEQLSPDAESFEPGTDFELTRLASVGSVEAELVVANPDGGGLVCDAGDLDGVGDGRVVLFRVGECGAPEVWNALAMAGIQPAGLLAAPPEGETGLADASAFALPVILELPTLLVSGEVADELAAESGVDVAMSTGTAIETRTAHSVVAETDRASGDEVIVLGAHLDSYVFSPGINDNASGVAGLLTFAAQLADSDVALESEIRFGFWAAEERGLLGSQSYVQGLAAGELDRIAAYLNFDMIGSPNWGRFVYDPAVAADPDTAPPGSEEITDAFEAWFDQLGLPIESIWTDGRSDDGAFAAAGIPVGGVFSGGDDVKSAEQAELFGGEAGEWFDPCYHLACDTIENVDRQILAEFGTAMAAVALHLAGADEPGYSPPAVVAEPTFTG